MEPILSLASSMHSSKGVYAVLLGSGVSSGAGIPTGWGVTLSLAERLATVTGEDPAGDPAGWFKTKYGKDPSYSELLAQLAPTPADRRNLLRPFFEPTAAEREEKRKVPGLAHRAIAQLVQRGFIRVILTTNFDRLMEQALQELGIEPTVVATAADARGAAPLAHQTCLIIKLHGDYLQDSILNTEAELSAYEPDMTTLLDSVLDQFGLVVCGWSSDWDPALRARISASMSRRYMMWFACTGKPTAHANALITARGGQTIAIDYADSFFERLKEMIISLEELRAPDTISSAVAVATLKRYLPSADAQIRLHDLLMGEAKKVRERCASGAFTSGPWSDSAFVAKAQYFESTTEVLRSLLFHLAYWGDATQQGLILRCITLNGVTDDAAGDTRWIHLRRYPIVLLFYAAALGAVAAKRYTLLKVLTRLKVQLRHEGDKLLVQDFTAIRAMVPKEALLLPNSGPSSTATSNHLYSILAPLIFDLVADAGMLFDEVEILIALDYLDSLPKELRSYLPMGRFAWRGTLAAFTAEAETQRNHWGPLKAGLFAGDWTRYVETRKDFDRVLDIQARGIIR